MKGDRVEVGEAAGVGLGTDVGASAGAGEAVGALLWPLVAGLPPSDSDPLEQPHEVNAAQMASVT